MELGQHSQAALLFERIAYGARDLGMTRRAPPLFFQGARAHLLAGNSEAGAEMLWQGLKLLANEERWDQLERAGARIVDELERIGEAALAEEVSEWVEKALAEQGFARREIEPAGQKEIIRGRLPINCGNCGVVLRLDEVEWIDSSSAVCTYCGSIIRTDT